MVLSTKLPRAMSLPCLKKQWLFNMLFALPFKALYWAHPVRPIFNILTFLAFLFALFFSLNSFADQPKADPALRKALLEAVESTDSFEIGRASCRERV